MGSQTSSLTLALGLISTQRKPVASLNHASANSTPFTRLGFRTKLTPNEQIRNNNKRRCFMNYQVRHLNTPMISGQQLEHLFRQSLHCFRLASSCTALGSQTTRSDSIRVQNTRLDPVHDPLDVQCRNDTRHLQFRRLYRRVGTWYSETARDYVYNHWDPH